jgi:hypothetical protein
MARYAPLWQQAGSYPANIDRQLINALWPAGGCRGGVVTVVNNTMNLSIAPGKVAVPLQSGQGSALCVWDANEAVTLAAAPPSGQQRIDVLCVMVRDNQIDGGANNDWVMAVVTGVPAASNPVTPATPANAMALYRIIVVGGAANLNGAGLIDVRPGRLAVTPPLGCQVAQNASVTVTSYAAVPWDTATYDPSGLYVLGSGIFTIKADGRYAVDVNLRADRAVAWNMNLDIDTGGGFVTTLQVLRPDSALQLNSGMVGLRAGHRLRIGITGTAANMVGGTVANWCSIHYVQGYASIDYATAPYSDERIATP